MTIKWGDPIECNGVRPDWLRDDEQRIAFQDVDSEWYGWETQVPWVARELNAESPLAIRLPADHPAYVALARGFTPWSGGESAPDDWDGDTVLVLDGYGTPRQFEKPREVSVVSPDGWSGRLNAAQIIGYRKCNTEPHLARIEVEGSAPVEGVFIKRMTETEFAERFKGLVREPALSPAFKVVQALGIIETTAERFTRETGHAVTEAVEAALNWKDTQS